MSLSVLLFLTLVPAFPQSQHRRVPLLPEIDAVDIGFTAKHLALPSAEAVYLLGDLPELGGGDLTRALPMQSEDGFIWRLGVALPPGKRIPYSFWVRDPRLRQASDPTNGTLLEEHVLHTPRSGVRTGKHVFLHSDFVDPVLHWRQDEADFERVGLMDLGPGRVSGERLWGVEGLGRAGHALEFFVTDGAGLRREPDSGWYATPLERMFLQEAELFTYFPAADVGPRRPDYGATPPTYPSLVLGEEREYRVVLPRGYDEHAGRRYPVLYHFDGELMWDIGGQSWDNNGASMAALVASGSVAELIQVGVTAGTAVPRNSVSTPPEDLNWRNGTPGRADQFVRFLAEELKPLIDATYRTKPERENTLFAGYSAGGLLAVYVAVEADLTFGGVGAQSPFLGTAPNFRERIQRGVRPGARLYLDVGTREGADPTGGSYGGLATQLWGRLLGESPRLVLERDLRIGLGFEHTHSFVRGGQRMAAMLGFLAPASRERAPELWP